MGTIIHRQFTATTWNRIHFDHLYEFAIRIRGAEHILRHGPVVNGHYTLILPTCGSKAGWEEYEHHVKTINRLIGCIKHNALHFEYVDVKYSSDTNEYEIVRHTDSEPIEP